MSHDFSLQCYLAAQQEDRISRHQYADLESLVHRLGLVDLEGRVVRQAPDVFQHADRAAVEPEHCPA